MPVHGPSGSDPVIREAHNIDQIREKYLKTQEEKQRELMERVGAQNPKELEQYALDTIRNRTDRLGSERKLVSGEILKEPKSNDVLATKAKVVENFVKETDLLHQMGFEYPELNLKGRISQSNPSGIKWGK